MPKSASSLLPNEVARTLAVRNLFERGIRTPSKDQIRIESRNVVRRFNATERESGHGLVLDYTGDILVEARNLRREETVNISCVLYAMWLEHKINGWVRDLASRMSLPKADTDAIIRDSSHRAKTSWLLRLLGAPRIAAEHLRRMQHLMDRRNAFVHYKWVQHRPSEDRRLLELLRRFEATVTYVRRYEVRVLNRLSDRKVKEILRQAE